MITINYPRPMAEFFPFISDLGRRSSICTECSLEVSLDRNQERHVAWHNALARDWFELNGAIARLSAERSEKEPECLCGTLDDGDAVVDNLGRVWTICRDGGMIVRPAQDHVSNVESGGIHWLEQNHGPVTVVYRKSKTRPSRHEIPTSIDDEKMGI